MRSTPLPWHPQVSLTAPSPTGTERAVPDDPRENGDEQVSADQLQLLASIGLNRSSVITDLLALLRDARNAESAEVKNSLLRVSIEITGRLAILDEDFQGLIKRFEPALKGHRAGQAQDLLVTSAATLVSELPAAPVPNRSAELENALDREALLRAQHDVLTLRLERTGALLRSAREERDTAQRELHAEVGRLRLALDQVKEKAVADERTRSHDSQTASEARLDATARWARLLGRTTRHLGESLKRAELPIREALVQDLHTSSQDLAHLNPKLLETKVKPAGRNASQKSAAVDEHMRVVAASRLFHPEYYRDQFAPGLPRGTDLLRHYVTRGWLAGANPNPLFNVQFYLMRNPSLLETGTEPLRHYIETGSAEGRDPHPTFVTRHYASLCGDEPGSDRTWLRRFLRLDLPSSSPNPLFDPVDYAKRAGLQETHAAVTLLHYLLTGWKSGLRFGALFDPDFYRFQLGEDAVQTEPYGHYVLLGAPHRLNPHPLFDTAYYLHRRPGLNPSNLDPLVDYLLAGEADGISCNPLFDPAFYRTRYMNGRVTPAALDHYLAEGSRAGHDPHPDFDAKAYGALRQPATFGEESALAHFLRSGFHEIDWAEVPGVTRFDRKVDVGKPLPGADAKALPKVDVAPVPTRHYPGKVPARDGRPTVLLVAHAAGEHLFGSERSFLDMLDGLAHVPVNVCVAVPRNVPTYTNAIRALCQDVYVFDYRWWRKGEASSPQVRAAFRTIIAERRVDAVHVNTIMLREALEAARECGVPGVVQVRELIGQDAALQDLIGQSPEAIIAETKRRSDWIIGNSATTAAAFRKEERTFVIPNPVDLALLDLPPRKPDGTVRFGLISSNIPKKGLLDAVKLARLAVERIPKAQFVIIGPETDLIRDLKHQQQSGDVPANVAFAGYAATPKEAIGQLDVVLSFSHFAESFGRTVLEAMAARRPVIAYEWGAVPELIRHGETGYLVPFRKPEAAFAAVESLCESPTLVTRMGEAGRQAAVARYGFESYREAFARAYSTILPTDRGLTVPLVKAARRPDLKTVEPALKLAYFCWHFPVPSETFVLNELECLVRQGVDVIVFCRQSPHTSFKPGFAITHERVDSPARLAQRLRETGRTMVHAHFTYPTVTDMVWPACEEAGLPFTFMAHAQDIFRTTNDQKNRLAEIGASPWCRRVFTLSRFHLAFLVERGFPRAKIVINPNAVDTARFAAAEAPDRAKRLTRRIIAVHRFVEKKGLDLLIEAAASIRDLDLKIDLFGYGDREEHYRTRIRELGLDNVVVHGPLTQTAVVDTMRHADLFACPSIRTADGDMDGIPTSLVESMAAGLPVLTTDISGIPDLVTDEVTGIVAKPTPESLAAAIRRFYALPEMKLEAIIAAARSRAVSRHDVVRATRVLTRVWRNQTVDIIAVAWNNLDELKAVVRRAIDNTALPYHLIVCDNQSTREPVGAYLDGLWTDHDQVTVIHNNRNAMVGPGTNLALDQGVSDIAIYLCAKEGMSFAQGWEIPFIHAFSEQPTAGLVGTVGYSPTYLRGAQYLTGIKLFPQFRNGHFATENPDRVFGHVQGGLFGIRRAMYEAIGGFSTSIPHDYTDVEYSYYAESLGWTLAEAPGVLALFNKSRPTLSQRFEESVVVAHPVLLDQIQSFQGVADGRLKHCNVCDWFGDAFEAPTDACPQCKASPDDRSLQRWLGDSTLMYRRLPALGVGLSGKMDQIWAHQFQGPRSSSSDLLAALNRHGRLPNRPESLALALIRYDTMASEDLATLAKEMKRLLARDATLLIQIRGTCADEWRRDRRTLTEAMRERGFAVDTDALYASNAIAYSYLPIIGLKRAL